MTPNPWTMPLQDLKRAMQAENAPPSVPPEVALVNREMERFQQLCPDWRGTPEDADVLVRYLPENIIFPTAEQMRAAHAMAWRDGAYPPAPQPVENRDPNTMPLDQLRNIVKGEPPPPREWTMPLDELRPLVQAEIQPDIAAAYRIGSEVAHAVPHGMSETQPRSEEMMHWDRLRAEDARGQQ